MSRTIPHNGLIPSTETRILRLAGGRGRLRAGDLRLGPRLLRPAGLSARRAARRADGRWRWSPQPSPCISWSARSSSPICRRSIAVRRRRRDQGRRRRSWRSASSAGPWRREPWQLFAGHAAERRRLGGDGRGGRQRDRLAVVHPRATGGARHGLQRRQHRRRHVLAAVGRGDRVLGFPAGRGGDRRRRWS